MEQYINYLLLYCIYNSNFKIANNFKCIFNSILI